MPRFLSVWAGVLNQPRESVKYAAVVCIFHSVVTLSLVLLEWIFSHASQIAKADIADDVIQSFSKSGVNALVACVMAIICITALNLACEHIA